MTASRLSILTALLFASFTAGAVRVEPNLVLIANYNARIKINDQIGEVKAQAKVRNQSTFPIDFQTHRIEVTVTETTDKKYLAVLTVLEHSGGALFPLNAEPISFEGSYEIPVEFTWSIAEFSMNLAISVSVAQTRPN